jgi:hypothetical protein
VGVLGESFFSNSLKPTDKSSSIFLRYISILKPFWNFEYPWTHPVLVPSILIYADLLATGDARNIETARLIYEKEIARLVRED